MKKILLSITLLCVISFSSFAQGGTAILDDKDTGWTWTGFEVDEQPDGYNGQQHVAEATGSIAEFSFTGSSIKFFGETWNGAPSLEIFVDGVSKGTFSQSITPEGLKNLFATITGLNDVKHTVKLVSIGEWASIDYVEYTSASIVVLPDPNVTASADNPSWDEIAAKLADGDINTKWSAPGSTAWIQFAYKDARRWNKYALTSGNDSPTRDFKDWTLQGSTDGVAWDILDTQTGHAVWAARNSTLDFAFSNLKSYKFYKFDVTANNGDGVIQLSEIAFSFVLEEEALIFTTTGSAASYITWNNSTSHQADSVYTVEKTVSAITVDGVAEGAWSSAIPVVIKKIAHEKRLGDVLDLSGYPQSEADLKATYKALWTDNGMYMFIDVQDDMVRYQNPNFQWENDGIEFYFAKAVGEGKIQVIIPAMVGTTNPANPAAKDFESGSAVGSDPAYKVFGFDANNWDESTFNWAIKKTATGYAMEVFMDKDIVTNGNSDTNFGKDKMFAGDINVDEADERQNSNDPALYVREGSLALLGNSNQEYANSNYYGYFKLVDNTVPSEIEFTTTGSAASYITWNNSKSHQADSLYTIEKTGNVITVDGVAEGAWAEANQVTIKKIAHEKRAGDVLDLSTFPQSESDLYATYKALWTTNGVYMFIDVKDDLVRYQNPNFQWENDGIEMYFAKAVGEGKIQVIIPAMVGTTNPANPAAKDFESGSAVGSDPAYKVFGFDANNWDESTFNWAIKKTTTGYTMEVYMDKDIVTNGNSDTNFGLGKMFAGDINIDEADERQNSNDPALYVREGSLALLGNSNQEYASSNYYGTFKMVDDIATAISTLSVSDFNVFYNAANKQITIKSSNVVSATLYNMAGQAMSSQFIDGKMSVANIKSGIYIINAKDAHGKRVGSQKVAIF